MKCHQIVPRTPQHRCLCDRLYLDEKVAANYERCAYLLVSAKINIRSEPLSLHMTGKGMAGVLEGYWREGPCLKTTCNHITED